MLRGLTDLGIFLAIVVALIALIVGVPAIAIVRWRWRRGSGRLGADVTRYRICAEVPFTSTHLPPPRLPQVPGEKLFGASVEVVDVLGPAEPVTLVGVDDVDHVEILARNAATSFPSWRSARAESLGAVPDQERRAMASRW